MAPEKIRFGCQIDAVDDNKVAMACSDLDLLGTRIGRVVHRQIDIGSQSAQSSHVFRHFGSHVVSAFEEVERVLAVTVAGQRQIEPTGVVKDIGEYVPDDRIGQRS